MNCYYFTTGGNGDIIYSIPCTMMLGEGIYWFGEVLSIILLKSGLL